MGIMIPAVFDHVIVAILEMSVLRFPLFWGSFLTHIRR
jgi:hypothetical protein